MSTDKFLITERKNMVINLKKDKGIDGQKAQVVLALDYSISMDSLYRNGTVQDVVERILPLGLAFDDNGEVDFYLFHDGFRKVPENITFKNIDGYINSKVIGKYDMGGTNYAPVINEITKDFTTKRSGLFGMSKTQVQTLEYPVYVIFITDGENFDKPATERALIDASQHGIFFQFVGIGNSTFNFLDRLDNLSGRKLDNANFFKVRDIRSAQDTELYNNLMNEFPGWLTQAKGINLIK
jgi:hypothetical protein